MRMQPENFDKLRVIAALNKRSMAMQIEFLLEQYIADYEAAHGKINLVGSEQRLGVVQNNGGTNFIAMGDGNSFNTSAQ